MTHRTRRVLGYSAFALAVAGIAGVGAYAARRYVHEVDAQFSDRSSVSRQYVSDEYGQPRWINDRPAPLLETLNPEVRLVAQVSQDQGIPELRHRAEDFYAAWKMASADGVWKILSPDIRDSVQREHYFKHLGEFFEGTKLTEYQVLKTERKGDSAATVITKISLSVRVDPEKRRDAQVTDVSRWVLEEKDHTWYFDGLLPASQPKLAGQ